MKENFAVFGQVKISSIEHQNMKYQEKMIIVLKTLSFFEIHYYDMKREDTDWEEIPANSYKGLVSRMYKELTNQN